MHIDKCYRPVLLSFEVHDRVTHSHLTFVVHMCNPYRWTRLLECMICSHECNCDTAMLDPSLMYLVIARRLHMAPLAAIQVGYPHSPTGPDAPGETQTQHLL